MASSEDRCATLPDFRTHVQQALTDFPRVGSRIVSSRAPGVADVMGGICEGGGALVLTATLELCFRACVWHIAEPILRMRLHGVGPDEEGPFDVVIPFSALKGPSAELAAHCRTAGAEWAVSSCLAIHAALSEGVVNLPGQGIMVVLATNFPPDSDFGRPCVTAAVVLDGLCKLLGVQIEPIKLAPIAAKGGAEVAGISRMRMAITALCGGERSSLLQIRTHPKPSYQIMPLPAGVIIRAIRTKLTRPTTRERLVETSKCGEVGTQIIGDLRRKDGQPTDDSFCLAAITPEDYVENYRDRMPSKSNRAFGGLGASLRGLPGGNGAPNLAKVRSRTEHHIYENDRARKFVSALNRADRQKQSDGLIEGQQLIFASHWSHSQRCGIGGVEADLISQHVRMRGPADGLYGAKVTGGGGGGEMIVLMQDTEAAHASLKAAIASAEAASRKKIEIYGLGSSTKEDAAAGIADLLA